MWPFSSHKHKTLSHAVLAGDLDAARKMLVKGADPNRCNPDDDAYPIHYAVNHGPEMVQLLVDYGADVNIPARGSLPLAVAEARGFTDVAKILRKAGAKLRSPYEEFLLDPRIRLQLEPKIAKIACMAHIYFPNESPEEVAKHVEEKLNMEFPQYISGAEQESIRRDVRALIQKKCGVKNYQKSTLPSVEQAKIITGMSEDELTRRFMEHLIQQGKNPFADMPNNMLRDVEMKFPDLVQLAHRKFGTNQ